MDTTIYTIYFPFSKSKLVLPTMNDIKLLIKENEDLFDLLLLNKLTIKPQIVTKNSKLYHTAIKNAMIQAH